jgi:hypothetical protein
MKGLETWQAFNKSAKIAVVVLFAFLAASLVRSCGLESDVDKWRDDFNEFRTTAQADARTLSDSLNARTDSVIAIVEVADERADSLTTEIDERTDEIENLQDQVEVIIVATDSTFDALTGGAGVETVVEENVPQAEPWIRLAYDLRDANGILITANIKFSEQVFDLEQRDVERVTAADALRAGLAFQTFRADSLEATVFSIPEGPPREVLLGFIPLPSRQASFLIGGITAIVGYIFFDKWLSKEN